MSNPDKSSARLVRFEVRRLFGEFDHVIPFNLESRVTAIIAPNGSGKTVCLRLIDALFAKQWALFWRTRYDSLKFTFTDGTNIEVQRLSSENDEESARAVFKIHSEGETIEWTPELQEGARTRPSVERFGSFILEPKSKRFADDITAFFTTEDVLDPDVLPNAVRASLYKKEPPALATLLGQVDCHLIETQRLFSFQENRRERRRATPFTIARKAEALRAIIAKELTSYATLSQSLDRSFPRRVIQTHSVVAEEALKALLAELDEQRKQLMDAGILDTELDQVSLPDGEKLDHAVARVLTIYATDTKTKLESLSVLLARIKLFKSLIEQRFAPKTVVVTKEKGFGILNRNGSPVPLENLSSGEQHQLVLFFELLFELEENALILIDEPELSLHISWQKKFIGDLHEIIGLNKFDVVLATHSPQLIGRWQDLVVELGKIDNDVD